MLKSLFLNNDVVLGYTNPTDKYYQAVKDWMLNRHDYKIEKDWIVISNGIVPALFDSVVAFTNKNEGVIIFTPVYHPFYQAIETNERQIIKCPLINQDTSYTIDFNKFKNLAKDPNNTMLILCNPHNIRISLFHYIPLTRTLIVTINYSFKIIFHMFTSIVKY